MSTSDIPTLIEPPPEEIVSIDAWRATVSCTYIDEYYKYYDSDGTVHLENDYEGSDSDFSECSTCDDKDTTDDENDDDDDEKVDVDDPVLTSRHNDPKLQEMVFQTEYVLEQLSLMAQPLVEEQPMSTRVVLANQAVEVFERYGGHGSMARFSEGVKGFLEGGKRVRRGGAEGKDRSKDGILKVVGGDCDHGLKGKGRGKTKRKAEDDVGKNGSKERKTTQVGSCDGGVKLRLSMSKTGEMVVVTQDQASDGAGAAAWSSGVNGTDHARLSALFDLNSLINPAKSTRPSTSKNDSTEKTNEYLDNSAFLIHPRNSNTNTTTKLKPTIPPIDTTTRYLSIPPTTTNHGTNRPMLSPTTPSTAFARFTLNSPTTTFPPAHQNPHSTYSCTTHPTLNAYLATQPYQPLSLTFTWPATSRRNAQPTMPTPGLLDALNNILHLYNAEGRFMLSYYVRKFDTPAEFGGHNAGAGAAMVGGGVSGQQKVEPPHALFRLGIAQYLWSKVGKVIDNKEVDELGLNPEARRLFGEVWERHPSTAAWWAGTDTTGTGKGKQAPTTGDTTAAGEEEDLYAHASDFSSTASQSDTSDPDDTPTQRDRKRSRRAARANRRRKIQEAEKRKRESGIGGLNPMEKIILARATNVGVETVDAYWDDMRERTRAWGAMKMWCGAMEKRMVRKAWVEGRW